MKRRELLKNTGLLIGALGITKLASANDICQLTPKQVKGPFYPVSDPLETDFDLTRVEHAQASAIGQKVIVKGRVNDLSCLPVEGAIVEVWQACHTGRYNHPSDTSLGELDPNFQYFARLKTDKQGNFSFKTIIPGAYLASETWMRPPHIHFRVLLRGYKELITQMYFDGNNLNERDQILMALLPHERKQLIVKFSPIVGTDNSILEGFFPITIEKLK